MSPSGRWLARWWPLAATGLWLVSAGAGMAVLVDYATSPGDPAQAPPRWPKASMLPAPSGRPALVMAVHPRCPCTRASLNELARILARCPGCADVYVLVGRPAGAPDAWWKTDLWDGAGALPGVVVVADDAGSEAGRFGARVSGTTLVYDAGGRLAWSGGITSARGHEGDSAGGAAVSAILAGGVAPRAAVPVFGCALTGGG